MNRIEAIEALLLQCEKDTTQLQVIHDQLITIEKNRKALETYYQSDYFKDYEDYENSPVSYRTLDQDSIWNTLTEQQQLKIDLLKTIANTL